MLRHIFGCLGVLLAGTGVYLKVRDRTVVLEVPTRQAYQQRHGAELGDDANRLWFSVEALRFERPDLAVHRTLSRAQQLTLVGLLTVVGFFVAVDWNITLIVVVTVVALLYGGSLFVRLLLFRMALNSRGIVRVSDETARAIPDRLLPRYTVLVPAYAEPEVMGRLVGNLRALEYPRDKLQVLLLLEADDTPTIEAAREVVGTDVDVQVVLVPDGGPRTKPKALNYGLAQATGQIVTIYDAEDRPEPLQLRKAALALATAPADVVCVQARLDFFNPAQNMLTRWFTLDYRMWFTQMLPGLVQMGAPIPLGGTSNHFRTSTLVEVGAWDPFNVTEDADLGVRLHRLGYRTGVLDSVTLEEANSDTVNWVKQRSRWYKGYAQTALVHLRHPRQLHAEIGTKALVLFLLFVAGTPLLATLNPLFWLLTLTWFVFHPSWLHSLFPAPVYYLSLVSWLVGNGAVLYSWMLTTRDPKERLWLASVLAPAYWVLMALAASKALLQLVVNPSYWEKTTHGLDQAADETAVVA